MSKFKSYNLEISSNRMEIMNKNCRRLDELSKTYPELKRVSEIMCFYIPFLFSKDEEGERWYKQIEDILKQNER